MEHLFAFILLLILVNGAPIILTRVLGTVAQWPLDFNLRLPDGRRLLGKTKTIRGFCGAIILGAVCAPLLGFDWQLGLAVATAAMGGDILSSFIKRRLAYPSSSRALLLDQIPESVLPALICAPVLKFTIIDIMIIAVSFFVLELALSVILFRLKIRQQPY